MPEIYTLGSKNKRTKFYYDGSVEIGTRLNFVGRPWISTEFYSAILKTFSGKTIKGGFSMTTPPPDGFGEWVKENSKKYGNKLTPRHGSFIAAILVHEGYITSSLQGNAVILSFPNVLKK